MYVYINNERYGEILINIKSPYYTVEKITNVQDRKFLPVDLDSDEVKRAGHVIFIGKDVLLVQLYADTDINKIIHMVNNGDVDYTLFYKGENMGNFTIHSLWCPRMIYDRQKNCLFMRGADIYDELNTLRFRKQDTDKDNGDNCVTDVTYQYNPLNLTRSSLEGNYSYKGVDLNTLTHLYEAGNVLTGHKIYYSTTQGNHALFERDDSGLYRVIEYDKNAFDIPHKLRQVILPGYMGKVTQKIKEIHQRYAVSDCTDVLWTIFINKALQEINIEYARKFNLAVCFVVYTGSAYALRGINWNDCFSNEYITLAEIDVMHILENN